MAEEVCEVDYNVFKPLDYLNTYYTSNPVTLKWETAVIKSLHAAFASGHEGERLLEVCTGPSFLNAAIASPYYKSITLTDYAAQNREELKKWLQENPDTFDWSTIFKAIATVQGRSIESVSSLLRERVTEVLPCDLLQDPPLDVEPDFDCILSCLTLEAACMEGGDQYNKAVARMLKYLRPGGKLVQMGMLKQSYYYVGAVKYASIELTTEMVEMAVQLAGCSVDKMVTNEMVLTKDMADPLGWFVLEAHKPES